MGIKTVYVCDRCEHESQDPKGWYKAGISPLISGHQLIVKPFDVQISSVSFKHLCGECCVSKYISENLSTLLPENKIFSASQDGGEAASEPQYDVEEGKRKLANVPDENFKGLDKFVNAVAGVANKFPIDKTDEYESRIDAKR